MKKHSYRDLSLPRDFDIGEIFGDKEERNVVDAGEVTTWEHSDPSVKIRIYITSIVIAIWAICVLVCLIRFVVTGEIAPLVALLSVPLVRILGYYFKKSKAK